jgi:hypothetical protein
MKKVLFAFLFASVSLLAPPRAMADDDAAPAAAAAEAEPAAACTGDDCAKPPSGYDWAAAHNITDAKDCTEGDQTFKDGCVLYTQEKALDEGEKEFEGEGGDAE